MRLKIDYFPLQISSTERMRQAAYILGTLHCQEGFRASIKCKRGAGMLVHMPAPLVLLSLYLSCFQMPSTLTNSCTDAALFCKAMRSSVVKLISMICSRPRAPSLQGTPT